MGVVTTCTVTVTLDSLTVLGVGDIVVDEYLYVDVAFPATNGIVTMDILGEVIEVPCPAVDYEVTVDLSPLIAANLTINSTVV